MCDPAKNILYISMKCFHFFHSVQIAFLYSHLSFQILPLHLQVIFLEELQAGVSFHLEGIYTVQRNRTIPVNIYLFKVKNRNIRKSCEIYSKLTKTPERCHWRYSDVFVFNFEHIFTLFSSVSIVDLEQVNVDWD